MIEVVRGTRFYPPCIEMRGQGAPCGIAGKYFERKKIFKPEIITDSKLN
jgi:hypothetical protein